MSVARCVTERPCLFIPADPAQPVRVIPNQQCGLAELQALVGGYLELVRISRHVVALLEKAHAVELGHEAQLWCNEYGKVERLAPNARAQALRYPHETLFDEVVGDCFVMAVP